MFIYIIFILINIVYSQDLQNNLDKKCISIIGYSFCYDNSFLKFTRFLSNIFDDINNSNITHLRHNSTYLRYNNSFTNTSLNTILCPNYYTNISLKIIVNQKNYNNDLILFNTYDDYNCLFNTTNDFLKKEITLTVPIKNWNMPIITTYVQIYTQNKNNLNNLSITLFNPDNNLMIGNTVHSFVALNTLFIFPWMISIHSPVIVTKIFDYTIFNINTSTDFTSIIIMFNDLTLYKKI